VAGAPPLSCCSHIVRPAAYRLTDEVLHQEVGIWPLSVSTDRIGVTAMRCAPLLDALAAADHPVDRAGGGRVVEVIRQPP